MKPTLKNKTIEFLKSHPKINFDEFKNLSGIEINKFYFYHLKKIVCPQSRSITADFSIYGTISIPPEGLSIQTKKIISEIVQLINSAENMGLQVIENVDNKFIEIRKII